MRRAEPRTDLPPAIKCGSPFLRVRKALHAGRIPDHFNWKSWRSGQIADYHIERNEGPALIGFGGKQEWFTCEVYDLD
jgi:hypothetical protein